MKAQLPSNMTDSDPTSLGSSAAHSVGRATGGEGIGSTANGPETSLAFHSSRMLGGWPSRGVWVWVCVASVTTLLAAAEPSSPTATNVAPRVLSVSGPLQLGRSVSVRVEGLRRWVSAGNMPHKLLLFLHGRPSMADYPESVDLDSDELVYHLTITPDNRELWKDILRQPTLRRRLVVSVGPDADSHFPTALSGLNAATLRIVPSPWGVVSLALIGITLAALLYLARYTDLLRDAGPASTPDRRKPYSLARTQMAIWFYLIFADYLVIWLVTGDLNSITESLLGLMGISAGTALGGALIDNQKRDAAASQLAKLTSSEAQTASSTAQPQAHTSPASPPAAADAMETLRDKLDPGISEGFLRDTLSDGDGFSLHRFQIMAWTVALGVIFIATAYNNLSMPEFSPTLLGLMGISSGTYLGFKMPEK